MTASLDPGPAPDGPTRPPGRDELPRPARSEGPATPGPARLLRESLVDRLPSMLRRGTLDPAVRGAFGLATVALIAALVASCYAWQARPRAVALPPATGAAAPAPDASAISSPAPVPTGPAGRAAPTAGAGQPADAVVHVAGRVRRPGVVTVAASARVNDAVIAAGGALPGTDLSSVDLARHVVDGEQILVGMAGTPAAMPTSPSVPGAGPGSSPAGQASSGPAAAGQGPAGGGPGEVLNLNTASPEQLDGLPGVGPVLAQRIIAWRTEHGGFRSVDELREVKGLGGKKFDDIAPLVRV